MSETPNPKPETRPFVRVSIVGATGLVGECLIRAVLGHPQCKLALLVSEHAAVYEKWYKEPHACKELLADAVYGLPELFKAQIQRARLVGNPGCYVTSATLALAPFVQAGLIELDGIVIDSYSGLSGAGRQY